uniref:CUB domain-containing protein n=1 Tax=Macrostomum lignano TaxID=282301 RepID=A0A1I8HMW3_9PLAT
MLTECLVDFLRITDGGCSGDGSANTVGLLSYDGGSADMRYSVPLIAYSGCMTLDFLASPRINKNGFKVELVVEHCPASCMSRGTCNSGVCQCSPGKIELFVFCQSRGEILRLNTS